MSIKLIFASTAALALVAGTPAFAAKSQSEQVAASDNGAAGSDAKAKGERKTCRTIDNTESRMKRQRLCFTKAQWKQFDQAQ